MLLIVFQSCITEDVGIVKAYDPNPKQALTFKIVSGNDNNAFTIDNTGLVKVNSRQALVGRNKFELLVSVTDDGKMWNENTYVQDIPLSASAIITINETAWNKK